MKSEAATMTGAGRPLLLLTFRPNTTADRERLDAGLRQMLDEDPTLNAESDTQTGMVTVGALTELQLEIVIDRLRRDFQVEAAIDRVSVGYREALTRPADGEARFAHHAGGRGEYAHAKIHVCPGEPGSGFVFQNRLIGATIPDRFVEPIRDGIEERCARGVLAGYPLMDVRVGLYDGSYQVDSSERAFKIAGAMAFENAAKDAAPVLLEPVMRVEVVVPKEHGVDVVASLLSRRGQIQADTDDGNKRIVQALVPLSEVFGYGTDLRLRTRGRGTHSLQFYRYARFDAEINGDDRASLVGVPLQPAPKRRDSAVALPEPDDDRAEI